MSARVVLSTGSNRRAAGGVAYSRGGIHQAKIETRRTRFIIRKTDMDDGRERLGRASLGRGKKGLMRNESTIIRRAYYTRKEDQAGRPSDVKEGEGEGSNVLVSQDCGEA